MELSPRQALAYNQTTAWVHAPGTKRVLYLGGYAGTGKTTLVAKMLQEYPELDAVVLTPTGKAAQVLRTKGVPAQTIHSAIYSPSSSKLENQVKALRELISKEKDPKESTSLQDELNRLLRNENLSFGLKDDSPLLRAKLVIVDEFSMVSQQVLDDLLEYGIPVLGVGDPGQLPPVKGGQTQKPDIVLTEIHRQAENNPIIKLAWQARTEGKIDFGDYGAVRKIRRPELNYEDMLLVDQIIVAKNDTRRAINRHCRKMYKYEGLYPVKGDKLVCKKNDKDRGLFNGMPAVSRGEVFTDKLGEHWIDVEADGTYHVALPLYLGHFDEYAGNANLLSWQERRDLTEFDFGYAITCHSSQGSEWGSVMVFDEPMKGQGSAEYAKWLYTAVTRAREKLIIVDKRGD